VKVKDTRNVPANVLFSAQLIADIRGIHLDEVIAVTTENARALFTRLEVCD
jgi:Tat protein secretion system quality control protein TatD with DNase activity